MLLCSFLEQLIGLVEDPVLNLSPQFSAVVVSPGAVSGQVATGRTLKPS